MRKGKNPERACWPPQSRLDPKCINWRARCQHGGPSRNRTGVQGFAVLRVTTPPSGRGEEPLWRTRPLPVNPRRSHQGFDEWRLARAAAADKSQLDLQVYYWHITVMTVQ